MLFFYQFFCRQVPFPNGHAQLLYFFDGESNVANSKKPISEIVFVYNRGVSLKGPEGVVTHCSLFARIPGDWKFDWVDFREACRKALSGVRGMRWHDVRVDRAPSGAPSLALSGATAERDRSLGVTEVKVALTHERTMAAAFCVAVRA